jgi:hypothetical protein
MIADLKADSERWDAERRQTQSRGQPSNGIPLRDSDGIVRKSNTTIVEYRASTTHQSRQYYGPTEAAPGMATTGGYAQPASAGSVAQQPQYDQYGSSGSYAQPPSSNYASTPSGYPQDNNYYIAGAHLQTMPDADSRSGGRAPISQSGTVPRGAPAPQYGATPSYAGRDNNTYYSPQPPATSVSSSQYPPNPTDPYYGRGAYNHPTPFYFLSVANEKSLTV